MKYSYSKNINSTFEDAEKKVINTLMERELITVKGRSKTAGRPLLFGTTRIFLESFGLEKTTDLPKMKELSELMGDNTDPVLFDHEHAAE